MPSARFLFLLPLALAGVPAHAQLAGPGVTPPLVLHAFIEGHRSHGCSRSHESASAEATLILEVDAAGHTSLRADVRMTRVSGPSFGAYRAGDHDFSTLTELFETRWRGIASPSGSALDVALDHRDEATVRIAGYGTAPLPPATSSVVAVGVRCEPVTRPVLPASGAGASTPASLVACHFDGAVPEPLDRVLGTETEIVFSADRSVQMVVNDPDWGTSTMELRRR